MKKSHYIFILILSGIITYAYGQDDDYYKADFIRNQDYIYHENIRTVLLFRSGNELSAPVIELHSNQKLLLSFDDLDANYKNYRYTVVHCDAYWNESDIMEQEYIDGFMDEQIRDYRSSFNTIQVYTNYTLLFPTDYMKLRISGNYILRVFVNNDSEENIAFTRRFMIVNTRAEVYGKIVKTVYLDQRYTHQQVDFKVKTNDISIANPYQDIHVIVRQNDRWDNAILNVKPRMILTGELDYSVIPELSFEAGNEFRYFDMKTVRYRTDRMQRLNSTAEAYEVYLLPDKVRANRPYITEEDINGRRLIHTNQKTFDYTQSEYAWVSFILPYNQPFPDGSLYIFGALSNWQFSRENRMIYDTELKAYSGVLYLKQGYYNYSYAFLPDISQEATVEPIEGSCWETENEYSIYIYLRDPGVYYDQLISVAHLNSTL